MMGVIAVLLLLWAALSILGALIEGLFWLAILGAVLFLGTAFYAAIKRSMRQETH
ncbi:MAG: hypothetical protein ACT4NP_21815 [Pseudonocardiales bacterium]